MDKMDREFITADEARKILRRDPASIARLSPIMIYVNRRASRVGPLYLRAAVWAIAKESNP